MALTLKADSFVLFNYFIFNLFVFIAHAVLNVVYVHLPHL